MTRTEFENVALRDPLAAWALLGCVDGGLDGLHEQLARIPQHCHGGLACHVTIGRPTGSFLYAILTNNLYDAVVRADDENIAMLRQYSYLLHNAMPPDCFGSPEKVKRWREQGGARALFHA